MMNFRSMALAIVINIYFALLCLGLSHLRYGAIDDYFMAGLLSGIYGDDYNVHMLFVNAVYGYILLPLYHFFPKISWYYIGEITSIFVSLTLIVYLIICKIGSKWGGILGSLLVATYAKDLYVVLQFTLCSVVLSAAGMLAVIRSFDLIGNGMRKSQYIPMLTIGIFLLWWGSLMRWESFLMGIPFFCFAFVIWQKEKKIKWNVIVLTILVILTCVLGSRLFNYTLYQTPEYRQFVDFQSFRVLLGDGSFYNEQAIYEDLQEMGESSKDFGLLKKWFFYDNEVFSPEYVQTVEQMVEKYAIRPSLRVFPLSLLQGLSDIAYSPIFIAWVIFSLVMLFSNRQKSFLPWLFLLLFLTMLSYLLYINRPVYRVQMGLFFYATVLMSIFWKSLPKIPQKLAYCGLAIVLITSGLIYYNTRDEFRSLNNGMRVEMPKVYAGKGFKELFQYMDSEPDSVLFLTPMNSYMDFAEYRLPPYLNEPMGSWERIVPTGYWTPYYPDVENAFRKRGMNNPMKDAVKGNVFYISDTKMGTLLTDFLEEHYYDSITVDTVKRFGDINVLKYRIAGGIE